MATSKKISPDKKIVHEHLLRKDKEATEGFMNMLNSLPEDEQKIIRYELNRLGIEDPIKVPNSANLMILIQKMTEAAIKRKKVGE